MIILKLPLQSMIGNIRQFISETKDNQFYILVYFVRNIHCRIFN